MGYKMILFTFSYEIYVDNVKVLYFFFGKVLLITMNTLNIVMDKIEKIKWKNILLK
jgi:hypothetical protein